MDAEYLKAKARMTKKCARSCVGCPLGHNFNGYDMACGDFESHYPEEAVAIVEKWANKHPIRTRQDEFLERYPNARKDEGIVIVCPKILGLIEQCLAVDTCVECYEAYWLEEVE